MHVETTAAVTAQAAPDRRAGSARSRFRAGQLVRVRSAEEIAATLDENGTLDGLPFMPEMVSLCGTTARIRSSAHKTCAFPHGLRGLGAAVHLEGLHCDGAAHGGCQSRCSLFWKDAWLEPVEDGARDAPAGGTDDLLALARRSLGLHGRDAETGTYACQATELLGATVRLPAWSVRQYWDDVRSGNVGASVVLRGLAVLAFNLGQSLSTRVLPPALRIRGGRTYPTVVGTLTRTPDVRLDLQPGEEVEIRPQAEILETVSTHGSTRGLQFDYDMVPYCGTRAVVSHRVETRIDEDTGELVRMDNPCVVLEGVACRGRYHRFCPRALDCYWREAWLRRVEPEPGRDLEETAPRPHA